MKTTLFCIILMTAVAAAETPGELAALAESSNEELKFYSAQVAALPAALKAEAPVIEQPLEFPSRSGLRQAVLGLDAEMAGLYLAEFREVLGSEVRLKAMEYASASRKAEVAADLAARISALVKMLADRPAAGVEALVERRILEGAALPFAAQAAESKVRAALLKREINALLGRDGDAPLDVNMEESLPPEVAESGSGSPLVLGIREAQLSRGLGGLEAGADLEEFEIGGWFTREGIGAVEPASGLTRPGANAGENLEARRTRLLDDARRKLGQARFRRKLALDAAILVAVAILGALAYYGAPLLVPRTDIALPLSSCDLGKGSCTIELPTGGSEEV